MKKKFYSYQTKTKQTNLLKNICKKLFCPCFYCLNCSAELKKWYFKAIKLIFLNGNDCWRTSTKFPQKIFVRKYSVPVLTVWNPLLSQIMIFLSHRTHFFAWSQLLKNLTKFPWTNFCQKIFCPCFYCLKSFAELNNDTFKQ